MTRLDAEQHKAVHCTDPKILVLAPAGSGKTTVLVERIARLVSEGVQPDRILAITFTNKAADEMRHRLGARCSSPVADRLNISTIHAWAVRILRRHANLVGHTPGFTIYDDEDHTALMIEAVNAVGVKHKAKTLTGMLGAANRQGKRGHVIGHYRRALKRYNAIDFDGLLRLLKEVVSHPEVQKGVTAVLDHVLVDEYQDTSRFEVDLLNRVRTVFGTLNPANLFLVGDPMQAIYAWRGADPMSITKAASSDVTVIKLRNNYRSRPAIVHASNLIANAGGSPLGTVLSGRGPTGPTVGPWAGDLIIDGFRNGAERAMAIATYVEARSPHGSVLVLGRSWRALNAVAAAIERRGVEFDMPKKDGDVWRSHAMRWLVAMMRCTHNPDDPYAARRVCAWPVQHGDPEEVYAASEAPGPAVLNIEEQVGWDPRLEFLAKTRSAAGSIAEAWSVVGKTPLGYANAIVAEINPYEMLARRGLPKRADQLQEGIAALASWTTRRVSSNGIANIETFLEWYAFRDVRDWTLTPEPANVQLLTIHAAKGLEADFVVVTGMDEGGFPRDKQDGPRRAEELRVFYVAVTRARDQLLLIWNHEKGPSPFLSLVQDCQ